MVTYRNICSFMYKHVLEYTHIYFLCQVTEPISNYIPVIMNTFSLEFLVSSAILKLKKQIINSKQKNIIYDKWENDSLCDYYDNEVISCLILKIRFIVFNSYNEKDLLKSSHCITIVKLQTKLNTNTKYQRHNPPFTILVIEYVTVQSTDFELQLPMCYWWFHRLLPSFVILSKSLYSSVPQFPYLKNENNENPHVVVVRMKWDNMKLNLEQSGI